MMIYNGPLVFTGDHLAQMPGQPTNIGNPGDKHFGMELKNASGVGGPTDFYRLVWTGNINSSDTTFKNGQFWEIQKYDPSKDPAGDPYANDAGWPKIGTRATYSRLTPKNDIVAGMGAGDNHIVFSNGGGKGHLVLDMSRSFTMQPTNLFYPGPPNGNLTFDKFAAPMPACFTLGTLIDTPEGPRPIEDLSVGDKVLTLDNGPQPVRWIGTRKVGNLPGLHARQSPIRIAAGALGEGCPKADLVVSPQHRILIRSSVAQAMFGAREVLVAAKQLVAVPGIEAIRDLPEVTYIHILLDRHEIVTSQGAGTETMFAGPEALKAYAPAVRSRIMQVAGLSDGARPRLARLTPKGGEARRLARLHVRDGLPLLQPAPALEVLAGT